MFERKINKFKEKYFLIDSDYEENKSRVILYFSKNPLSSNYDYILREKYFPYFTINLNLEKTEKVLNKYKGKIKIISLNKLNSKDNLKIICKNNYILKKCKSLLKYNFEKDILEIDAIRQFLINKNWSYFDSFSLILKNKIKKIESQNLLHIVIKKYLENINISKKGKLVEPITNRILLSNLLKVKPDTNLNTKELDKIFNNNQIFEKYSKEKQKIEIKKKYIRNIKKIDIKITDFINRNNLEDKDNYISELNKKIEDLEKTIYITNLFNNKKKLDKNIDYTIYKNEYKILSKLKSKIIKPKIQISSNNNLKINNIININNNINTVLQNRKIINCFN